MSTTTANRPKASQDATATIPNKQTATPGFEAVRTGLQAILAPSAPKRYQKAEETYNQQITSGASHQAAGLAAIVAAVYVNPVLKDHDKKIDIAAQVAGVMPNDQATVVTPVAPTTVVIPVAEGTNDDDEEDDDEDDKSWFDKLAAPVKARRERKSVKRQKRRAAKQEERKADEKYMEGSDKTTIMYWKLGGAFFAVLLLGNAVYGIFESNAQQSNLAQWFIDLMLAIKIAIFVVAAVFGFFAGALIAKWRLNRELRKRRADSDSKNTSSNS